MEGPIERVDHSCLRAGLGKDDPSRKAQQHRQRVGYVERLGASKAGKLVTHRSVTWSTYT